jgi:hypothetical protein
MRDKKKHPVKIHIKGFRPKTAGIFSLCLIIVFMQLHGCATVSGDKSPEPPGITEPLSMEEKWGVKIEGIRLTAAGHMLDFRYRIIDPDRALPLVDRTIKPYLIDLASNATLTVPTPAKVGPLRQTVRYGKPMADRIYFIFFANRGGFIKKGNAITVVIGDFKAENLIVE